MPDLAVVLLTCLFWVLNIVLIVCDNKCLTITIIIIIYFYIIIIINYSYNTTTILLYTTAALYCYSLLTTFILNNMERIISTNPGPGKFKFGKLSAKHASSPWSRIYKFI